MKPFRWQKEELSLLRVLWEESSIEDVYSAFPGKTPRAIRRTAERHGYRRPWQLIHEARKKNGAKGNAALKAHRDRQIEREDELLALQRVIVPAHMAKAVCLAGVLSNPLEAAWRGL